MERPVERVLIAGGGIAGLAAAAAIGKTGVEVDVVEIKPELSTVAGIGISLPNNALRAFKLIDVLDECADAGYVFNEFVIYDNSGELIISLPCPPTVDGVPGYLGIGRLSLSQILDSAARQAGATIRFGTSIASYQQDKESVQVTLSDGRQEEYDLLVGAEGVGSPLRRELFGFDHEPTFTGFGCWRVKMERDPEVTSMQAFEGVGNKAGLVPINQEEMYLYHVTTETGNPRHKVEEFSDTLAERLAGYEGMIGDIRERLPALREGIVYSPLEEVRLPSPWYAGRVLIIGDAAHSVVPHLSQGGSLCLEDAVVLGEMLGRRVPASEALAGFMERRYNRAQFLQDLSHKLLITEMDTDPAKLVLREEYMRKDLLPEHITIRAFLAQPA